MYLYTANELRAALSALGLFLPRAALSLCAHRSGEMLSSTALRRVRVTSACNTHISRVLATTSSKMHWNPALGWFRDGLPPKPESNHLAIVLDQSGSMSRINATAYEGARELLEDLAEHDTVSLTTFNADVTKGEELTKAAATLAFNPGKCGGTTALYDAICVSIDAALERHRSKRNVIVAIVTDGMENASKSKLADVKDRINRAHANEWRVTFLGANQDAVLAAQRMGIHAERALTYGHSMTGTREAFHSMRAANARFHAGQDESYTARERVASDPGLGIDAD